MDGTRKHILFVSGWYPGRVAPTLGNFVQKHAEAVAQLHDVSVLYVCADAGCKAEVEVVEKEEKGVYSVNVYYKKVSLAVPVISSLIKVMRRRRAYREGLQRILAKKGKPELIHHNIIYPSGMFSRGLSKQLGIPYIVTEHSTGWLESRRSSLSWQEKKIGAMVTKDAALVCPVSKDLQRSMISAGLEGKYQVVHNVVDTNLFSPGAKKKNEKFRFLHISTLDDAHKNISGMLRAAANLKKERKDFSFLILGDGDTTPHRKLAKELQIEDVVSFDGEKTTAQIAATMKEADCFLLFSNYENMPVVIIEALASGLPVISSDVGGIKEHIDVSKGILVKKGDASELCTAMSRMIDEAADKYDAKELQHYATMNFSYESVAQEFDSIYTRILAAAQ